MIIQLESFGAGKGHGYKILWNPMETHEISQKDLSVPTYRTKARPATFNGR